MLRASTSSPDETREVAAAIARLVEPGDLLLLAGDLGAGKTTFTQGLAAGLGVSQPVTSPTFTLAHRYDGELTVHHVDAYRLEAASEIADLDLPELLEGDSVTIIEWGDAIAENLPAQHLTVRFLLGAGDDDRDIELVPSGQRWAGRARAMADALEPWEAQC